MIEAVGRKNIPTFFRTIDRCLWPGGSCVVQAITGEIFSRTSDRRFDQFGLWLRRYIFPDGYLPEPRDLAPPRAPSLRIVDQHAMTKDYDRTLMAWARNFNDGWRELGSQYDERFRRRWNFYLHGCAAAFRAGVIGVSQVAYSKS